MPHVKLTIRCLNGCRKSGLTKYVEESLPLYRVHCPKCRNMGVELDRGSSRRK